jgi:type IV pilus assembly protein PilB
LRQDPDIISVGEIRDRETADIAFRSAVTGHLVLSTLHTNDAVSTLDRLDDIGVEPYMVATALKGVISQRLVRRVCPHCKETYSPTPEEMRAAGLNPDDPANKDIMFARGRGCPECYHTGYRGRIVVVETLTLDKGIRQAIATGAPRAQLLDAVEKSGFQPMLQNCQELVRMGITTLEEVQRVIFASED